MRIGVVANCQGEALAACIHQMLPWVSVEFVLISEFQSGRRVSADLATHYDVIFAQTSFRDFVPVDLGISVIYFPNLVFDGFHPDMTFVRAQSKASGEFVAIRGGMDVYQSSLVVYAYLKGKTRSEAVEMFSPETFSRLGYFEAFTSARNALLNEGLSVGLPLDALLAKWVRQGSFMYSFNHPKLCAVADVARALFQKLGWTAATWYPEDVVRDPMKGMPIWPVYPGIAERHGMIGEYMFRVPAASSLLPQFVEQSYAIFDDYERDSIEPMNFSVADFEQKLESVRETKIVGNPYAGVEKVQFWRNSVAAVHAADLDPVVNPRFSILPHEKLATAGSCFAQHIARTLSQSGFNYHVPEQAPAEMSAEEAHRRNYGVYSARFGNIYTVRQFRQLLERAEGRFKPHDEVWRRKDGRFVDPFRPQIEPDGYETAEEVVQERAAHLAIVRAMVREMEYFVFTLGLTEGWRSKYDGAVFPSAPGVAGGQMDTQEYEFVNFSIDEVRDDLFATIDALRLINPACRIILTVSPVPLIATYEDRHALVSTTYSKAVLRTAADEARSKYDHVEYFPSFEIITGSYNRGAYFQDDLREVRPEGVAHVMRVFMQHYTGRGEAAEPRTRDVRMEQRSALFDIVCDEEAIANF